jgi:ribosomal protein L29
MKKSAKADLRAKSLDDLKTMMTEARVGLMQSRFAKAVEGKAISIKNRDQRRQVARLETMIAEKQAAQAGAK